MAPEVPLPYKEIRTALLAVVAILTFYVGIRAYIRRIKKAEPAAGPEAELPAA